MFAPWREKFFGLVRAWWKHQGSLYISLAVTLSALGIYVVAFVGERPTTLFDFVARLELDSLDARFQLRGRLAPDPRIVVVDIDQHSQEVLGRWPFSRLHFARMLDALREDGARVVAFDITFGKPDSSREPLRALGAQLAERQKAGKPVSPAVVEEIGRLEKEADSDQPLAAAIERFGRVVLANYFLYAPADLEGVSPAWLDRQANLLANFPFPQVRSLASAGGPEGFIRLIQNYDDLGLLPKGAEANTEALTTSLANAKGGCGFFNIVADPDGVVRRALLALPYGRDPDRANWDLYSSIDIQAVRLYLRPSDEQTALVYGGAGIAGIELGSELVVRPDPVGRLLINYRGPARTYPYVSFSDVVEKKFSAGKFKDKLVLVGASATGIGDLRATPFGALDFPGVEIHANVIDNLLNQQSFQRGAPQALADLFFIFLFGVPLGIWLALVQPRWMFFGLLLLVPFGALVYWAFLHGRWLNFVVPGLFTLVPNLGLVALYRVLAEEKEKRRVRTAFQQYVSPEVVRRLLADPERLRPRKATLSVLFCDVRGFTTMSERLDAQELADLLNSYLTEMTKIIFRHQGTLDKYMGDAVMAFWGAPVDEPQHAERCCQAALEMVARVRELQLEWKARAQPVLDVGIGVNTGIASVGNMGSVLRYAFTAMGDVVNLSSRLEGLNKDYGTHILLGEATSSALRDPDLLVRELDLIRVKGKLQPVTICELMGRRSSDGRLVELADEFKKARQYYQCRKWHEASERFARLLDGWPDDGPSRVFLARCREYVAKEPPPNWDGVYVMEQK